MYTLEKMLDKCGIDIDDEIITVILLKENYLTNNEGILSPTFKMKGSFSRRDGVLYFSDASSIAFKKIYNQYSQFIKRLNEENKFNSTIVCKLMIEKFKRNEGSKSYHKYENIKLKSYSEAHYIHLDMPQ